MRQHTNLPECPLPNFQDGTPLAQFGFSRGFSSQSSMEPRRTATLTRLLCMGGLNLVLACALPALEASLA